MRLSELDGPFEIIDGERIDRMPPVMIHSVVIRTLFRMLDAYCQKHHSGEVFAETAFVLNYDANWVKGARIPDLMFIAHARWQRYIAADAQWQQKPLVIVPDLAIEVVSRNDLYTDLQHKVEVYQHDGVQIVWVIDPMRKRVEVINNKERVILDNDGVLDGGDVLPGFSVSVAEVFEGIED